MGDGRADDRGLEPVCLRDERHDAIGAITLSHDRHALGIRVPQLDGSVHAGHHGVHQILHLSSLTQRCVGE